MSANPKLGSTGLYKLSQTSGLLTTIAAGSPTAGHLFAFRWGSSALRCRVQRVKVRWQTEVSFTVAQELQFSIYRLTGYSASHSAGTAATLTTPNLKKFSGMATTALTDARIATAVALTAGTHTLDAMGMGQLLCWSNESATVPIAEEATFQSDAQVGHIMELTTNEGFIVRNEVLQGAAGVGRLLVEVDWAEL